MQENTMPDHNLLDCAKLLENEQMRALNFFVDFFRPFLYHLWIMEAVDHEEVCPNTRLQLASRLVQLNSAHSGQKITKMPIFGLKLPKIAFKGQKCIFWMEEGAKCHF